MQKIGLIIIALAMVVMVAGCASDPRISRIERHLGHVDKQIDYLTMDGLHEGEASVLIHGDRTLEEMEILHETIVDKANHPVKWWWKNKFKEWGE